MKSIAGWEDNREESKPEGPRLHNALAQSTTKRAAPKAAAKKPARMYRTNLRDVPKVGGLKRKDGWVDMQVQFLIDKKIRRRRPCGRLDRSETRRTARKSSPSQLR